MILPIRLTPVERHIHADRRLAFQVLTAFGVRQEDGSSSMVLKAEGDRKLVEFHSVIPTFRHGQKRGQKMYRTVEWVTLLEPEEIRFEGVEGPVDLLQDRFVLQNLDGCTLFRYESTIGIKGGFAGWLKGQILVRPTLSRFMRDHSRRLKETIEARAKNSRLYPYRHCSLAP
ncbi:MAG: hypothetical protein AUH77_08080 [Candidatus Rokubacteria bacterium 13_1_40CM_4_69_39]|nr:MAG: hypothetical protein AUH77_08080 [Candidatus Rokubacteria bacterium 13_1_40CM_4_69_39]OLC89763.1 MAG: hypothetical protein AUJ05_12500 [Candidatus Rokubacteria bacterium 13_1_40CM_3_69_38]OLD24221.1 MAG: hypothetical protein AUI18_10305 [Candidatus Rokubacteria bacterium 13_1_40CM_2_70_45]OLE49049.1 MAG: hypothetical protein AUG01_06435 [Candidatus Rokubacteria bacterium 13_1_20CM_2_69_58]PYM48479.1 MAG: hypothetical protein DME14_11475 [Candidatus Rokubacteria bacterium]